MFLIQIFKLSRDYNLSLAWVYANPINLEFIPLRSLRYTLHYILIEVGCMLAASVAVFCKQPHVILLKYGEI